MRFRYKDENQYIINLPETIVKMTKLVPLLLAGLLIQGEDYRPPSQGTKIGQDILWEDDLDPPQVVKEFRDRSKGGKLPSAWINQTSKVPVDATVLEI